MEATIEKTAGTAKTVEVLDIASDDLKMFGALCMCCNVTTDE